MAGHEASLAGSVQKLAAAGVRVSLFVDPDPLQIAAAARIGAQVVELHTGAYAEGRAGELERLHAAARQALALGLEVHAGHGLTYENVGPVAAIEGLSELNIGHFLIGQAIFDGLAAVVVEMKHRIALGAAAGRGAGV